MVIVDSHDKNGSRLGRITRRLRPTMRHLACWKLGERLTKILIYHSRFIWIELVHDLGMNQSNPRVGNLGTPNPYPASAMTNAVAYNPGSGFGTNAYVTDRRWSLNRSLLLKHSWNDDSSLLIAG